MSKSVCTTNIQRELLKLFSTDMSEEDLNELKVVLSRFYARKAIDHADSILDKNGLSYDSMDEWLDAS